MGTGVVCYIGTLEADQSMIETSEVDWSHNDRDVRSRPEYDQEVQGIREWDNRSRNTLGGMGTQWDVWEHIGTRQGLVRDHV